MIMIGGDFGGWKPQMGCTKKYFFSNLFYFKFLWKGKGKGELTLESLYLINYWCIFIVPVVQWIGLVYFFCYVHSSIKVILGHKKWCIILWIPFFIGPDFKIRSLPFIREHWRHETEKVCAFHVKMKFLRLPNCLSFSSDMSWICSRVWRISYYRVRVAHNYLSNGAWMLSPDDISLLGQYHCYGKRSSQAMDKSLS